MQRVAIIYDNTIRPETTGTYCRRALSELVQERKLSEVEHFLPGDLDEIPVNRFDLFLYIDDGIQQRIREDLRPAIWWGIDSHVSFVRVLRMASLCDLTFAAQRDGVGRLLEKGISSPCWLPLACDPEIHGRRVGEKQYDVGFVGHVFQGQRQELLREISHQYPNSFIGQKNFQEMANIYSMSKVVFNRSILNDINMRVFEGMCSGSLLLTNDLDEYGLNELLTDDVHYVSYGDREELFEKLRFYLQRDTLREQIAKAGCEHVLANHTYRHRMESLLTAAEKLSSRTSINVISPLPQKDDFYFEFDRPDVQAMVPESARSILDIGCGGGRLGEELKKRQPAIVTGVERDPVPAQRAKQRLDHVVIGDITSAQVDFEKHSFDAVICADVLEHLRQPELVLRRIREWLKPDGQLITSLPNVRNHTVVRSLLAGNWTYESAGLLDEDHLRFFTKREIEKLLFTTGYEVEEFKAVGGDGYQQWKEKGCSLELSIGPFQVKTASIEEAEEFYAYQYLTRSRVRSTPEYPLTSIVVVTHNQLSYTKDCLDSIRMRTTVPYEIIVVDNGSGDQTIEYLRSCKDVRLIENVENRGFPAAANQGISTATGDHVLLLNNDTLVTTGWLRRMLDALHSSENVGLVGPLTNNICSPQQIEVNYDQLAQLDGFAWDLSKRQRHVLIPIERLVGFCLLMRKSVIDEIGMLDERFGIGNFEDDDFCRRVLEAGMRCMIATDAFVHHFGSVTFKSSGIDFGKLLETNRQLYDEKWDKKPTGADTALHEVALKHDSHSLARLEETQSAVVDQDATARPRYLFDVDGDGAMRLRENDVHLSACLIVRDNESTIRPCLESLSPWVDEIIVVDTGSVDDTPNICEELGASVYHWSWCDDFSAARNESLKYANGEWIFWMDSDDTLPPDCGRRLRELASQRHDLNTLGFVMQVHCPGKVTDEVTIVDHVKLIKNHPGIRFEFCIHEQVLPSIRRTNGNVKRTDIFVVHSGSDKTVVGRKRKLERDFRLLGKDLENRPNHPFVLFNLGMTYSDTGDHEQAALYLEKCIDLARPSESHVRKAYALLVNSYQKMGHMDAAEEYCQSGLSIFPDDAELLFRMAMLCHCRGELLLAENSYRQLLRLSEQDYFKSVDVGITSFKALHNLAVVIDESGRHSEAIAIWEDLAVRVPGFSPAWRALRESYCEPDELKKLIDRLREHQNCQDAVQYLQSYLAELQGKYLVAIQKRTIVQQKYPEDEALLNDLCRILFEHGDLIHASEALTMLTELSPEDPVVWHNLAVVQERLGQADSAATSKQRSLELKLRPTMQTPLQNC